MFNIYTFFACIGPVIRFHDRSMFEFRPILLIILQCSDATRCIMYIVFVYFVTQKIYAFPNEIAMRRIDKSVESSAHSFYYVRQYI